MIKKEKIYEITFLDEEKGKVKTKGKNCRAGSIEYSWYDLNKKIEVYINKNSFISRVEVKKWQVKFNLQYLL